MNKTKTRKIPVTPKNIKRASGTEVFQPGSLFPESTLEALVSGPGGAVVLVTDTRTSGFRVYTWQKLDGGMAYPRIGVWGLTWERALELAHHVAASGGK